MYETELTTARVILLRLVTDSLDPHAVLIGGEVHCTIGDRPVVLRTDDTPIVAAQKLMLQRRDREAYLDGLR